MAGRSRKSEQFQSPVEHAGSQARIAASVSASGLPADYAKLLAELKRRIREQRLRVVLPASAAMVLLNLRKTCLHKFSGTTISPCGISWRTLPEELKGSLPTVEEMVAELQRVENEKKEFGYGA